MIQKIKISEVKANPSNPRTIKDDKFNKLVQSIKDFPQMLELRPIIVNDDMIVLGGNMRLKACKEAGLKEVSIIKASELTPEQQAEFIVKDNIGFGEWDYELLLNAYDSSELEAWGLDLPDLPEKELEAEEDGYEIADEIESDILIGDLFEIGEHRLLCGDSTKKEQWGILMNNNEADMVMTDPPYNIDYEGKTKEALKIQNDSMSNDNFYKFLFDFYTALGFYTKKGGGLVCLARINRNC